MHACHFFWLPPETPFGNLTLKLVQIVLRLDQANRRLLDSTSSWEAAREHATATVHAYPIHRFTNEEALYHIRRSTDELIALIWVLGEHERNGCFPDSIVVDCIAKAIRPPHSEHLKFLSRHRELLTVLNDLANSYKHSFVDSDLTVMGREEPCFYALRLEHNKRSLGAQFLGASLQRIVEQFNAFLRDALDWLKTYSHAHRNADS